MPRTISQQNNFNAGVLEPRLKGRIDVAQYHNGIETGDNVLVLPQGGLRLSPGLEFIETLPERTGGGVSDVRLLDFPVSADRIYQLVFTDLKLRIFRDGVFVYELQPSDITGFASLYDNDDLNSINAAQLEHVMVLVQEDKAPQRLANLGDDVSSTLDEIPFIKATQFDYNDGLSPTPTSDVQTITFADFTEGTRFRLLLNNISTGDIGFSSDSETTANNIEAELLKHPLTGFTGVSVVATSVVVMEVTFSGNSASDFDQIIGFVISVITPSENVDPLITVVHDTTGVSRKEDIWSDTRGFPKTVVFFGGRMYFGGLKSRSAAILASRSGSFFDFDTGEAADDDAIFTTLATRTLVDITNMIAGRQLQIFTTGSEFSLSSEIATPTDFVLRTQTNHGSNNVNPVEIDGATVFLERKGKTLREFIFTFQENSYLANNISVLAQNLFDDPVDMAALKGTSADDANYVIIVNTNGDLAILNLLRSQGISSYTRRFSVNGLHRKVGVSDDDVYLAIDRTIDGTVIRNLERWNFDHLLDSSTIQTYGTETTLIENLGHLEGQTVTVIADGSVLNDNLVVGGEITIERGALVVEVGLWATPKIVPMPLVSATGFGTNSMRVKSVTGASFRVFETDSFQLDGVTVANRFFAPADNSPLNTNIKQFTGIIGDLETNNGWLREQGPVITQEKPGKLTLLSMNFEMEST